jgi:IS4 transposase
MMVGVATRTYRSVRASYLDAQQRLGVSATAVYNKLAAFDPQVTTALVRETAVDCVEVINTLPGARREILPGHEVFYLDGNHLAATEHRLDALRGTREGPLPGQTIVLQDGQTDLVVDLVACECGHAQERSLLPELLNRIRAAMVIVADRNFCTTAFLFGLACRGALFVIRQHASTLNYDDESPRKNAGRCETGTLFEQTLLLTNPHATGDEPSELRVRCITLQLDTPTGNGEREIRILTNLPDSVTAAQVAQTYRTRWTIEGAFQTMTDVLRCEVETLGYPRAALFSFAMAVLAWNAYAVVQAALRSAHGAKTIDDELSEEHLINDVVITQTGMNIAVEPIAWDQLASLPPDGFARLLMRLARAINLKRYPKRKRGPRKPSPQRISGRENHHVSTAKLLAKTKEPPAPPKTTPPKKLTGVGGHCPPRLTRMACRKPIGSPTRVRHPPQPRLPHPTISEITFAPSTPVSRASSPWNFTLNAS